MKLCIFDRSDYIIRKIESKIKKEKFYDPFRWKKSG